MTPPVKLIVFVPARIPENGSLGLFCTVENVSGDLLPQMEVRAGFGTVANSAVLLGNMAANGQSAMRRAVWNFPSPPAGTVWLKLGVGRSGWPTEWEGVCLLAIEERKGSGNVRIMTEGMGNVYSLNGLSLDERSSVDKGDLLPAEVPMQAEAGAGRAAGRPRLVARLPHVLFVTYPRVAEFRLDHGAEREVHELEVGLASDCLVREGDHNQVGEVEVVCPVMESGKTWSGRLGFEPRRHGEKEFVWRVCLRRFPNLVEVYRGSMLRLVRERPRNSNDVKVAVEAAAPVIDDKADFDAGISGGIHVSRPQVMADARFLGRGIEDILDELDRAGTAEEVVLELAEVVPQPFVNSCGMEMEVVAKGSFLQGSPRGETGRDTDEVPRRIRITQPFWIGRYVVTQGEWLALMGTPGSKATQRSGEPFPANGMSWFQALDYCRRLTERERELGALPADYEYRLPTEAEWEYACRAGHEGPHYGPLQEIAVIKGVANCLQPVGTRKPNAWGLYDMLGNVYEWCLDAYGPYRFDHPQNPWHPGEAGDKRVIRGGCYQDDAGYARAASRVAMAPQKSSGRIGFRVVMGDVHSGGLAWTREEGT